MKVAVIGSRGYADRGKVEAFVYSLPKDWVIVSGGAAGPDSWAVAVARARGMTFIEHLPNDRLYPYKVARLERNKLIVADAEVVVGFWDGTSSGTLDAARRAVAARKPLRLVRPQDPLPTPLELFRLVK